MEVFILTEGGRSNGFGHITRCLSLYQAFKTKKIIPQILAKGDNCVKGLFKNINFQIFDWLKEKQKTFKLLKASDIAIIDSYRPNRDFYYKVSSLSKVAVFIDDFKRIDYPKGFVINDAPFAEELGYPFKSGVIYLLGTRYALLRKEFWGRAKKNIKIRLNNIIILLGGSDKKNLLLAILNFIKSEFPQLKKEVIVAKGFRRQEKIKRLNFPFTKFIFNPNAHQIRRLMLKADLAISAAGQTLKELAYLGVPTIAIKIAENQSNNIRGWKKADFICYAGRWNEDSLAKNLRNFIYELKDPLYRKNKIRAGKQLIDSKGSTRVVDAILKHPNLKHEKRKNFNRH